MRSARLSIGLIGALTIALFVRPAAQQPRAPASGPAIAGDWPMYRHDYGGTGFSPLTEVDASNVANLKVAWTYGLQTDAPPATGRGAGGANSQATPIVVAGRMYVPTANRIVALDPVSGKEIWQHRVSSGAPSRRGVAYWPGDATHRPRIFFSAGRRLVALDAATGAVDTGFGTSGEIDLVVPYNSVPLVARNIIVVGANTPPGAVGGIGDPRGFDARTGAKVWEFHSVPQPGEVGHDTWEGESWRNRFGANAWPFYFTLDEERGVLFVPLASPIVGAYGGDRKGANLFGNAVVAVDLETGKYKWHFQTIHHDLWDADPPAPPALFEITRNGRTVRALGLTTKSGYLYILDRETGQPIYGVEERPVPKSDVPGEQAWPTQPIPVKGAIARVSYATADLVTAAETTAEHAQACAELVQRNGGVFNAGPFTPWLFRADGAAAKSTLVFPGGLGGANWGGAAFDARNRYLLVATQDVGALGWVEKAREGAPVPYDKAALDRTFDVPVAGSRWPCQRPPWGRLMAVDTTTGDFAWTVPLGITEQLPADKQRTGRPLLAGPIVTASGLVFIASTDDNRFRAIDARSGRELWVTKLERRGNADPFTFAAANGRQYVGIVATETLVVYALP
jgi:quinoprotein glucose dehydrogenase